MHSEARGVFSSETFSVASDTERYKGNVVGITERLISDPDGNYYSRDVVFHPGAVAIAAVTDQDEIYLVRQYRAPVDGCIWEIPAGKKDVAGEPDEVTARRELEEEAGLKAGVFEPLIGVYQSAGFSDEFCQIFLARDLQTVPQQLEGPEELDMELARFSMSRCLDMIERSEITDAKTVAAIYAVSQRL